MDYDGNDISHHNLQLTGEGRTKSPSVLRPYDFPKFDFGESLQGHLKFDSLVETEVFLGIQSQEDSQWIEDFSRGSNGMEFNSTPADSCSISRRNNVWSEATSSESVEMLLKSVGQEETMPEQSIIPESNVCVDQGTLAGHAEPSSKNDDASEGYAANPQVTVPEDIILKDDASLKEHMEEQPPESELPSASHIRGEASGKDPYEDGNLRESKTCAEKSMKSGAVEETLHLSDGVDYSSGAPSTLEASEQVNTDVSHEGCDDKGSQAQVSRGEQDSKLSEGKIAKASEGIDTVYSSSCLVTELGGLNNQEIAETKVNSLGEINVRESEVNSSKKDVSNASSEIPVEIGKHEFEVSPASRPSASPLEGSRNGSAVNVFNEQSAELGSPDAGQLRSPKENIDSCLTLTSLPEGDKMENLPAGTVDSHSKAKMPLSSNDDEKIPIECNDCINETNASRCSDMPELSCATDNTETSNIDTRHNDSIITIQEPGTLLPVAIQNDPNQVVEENPAQMQVDISEPKQDVWNDKEKDEKLPTDPENVNSKNAGSLTADKMTQSLNLGKGFTIDDNVCKLEHQTAGKMELENVVASHSCTSRQEHTPENAQSEPAVIGSSHPENECEEDAKRIESDMNASTAVDSISKVHSTEADDSSENTSCEIARNPAQPVDISNDTSFSKSMSIKDMRSMSSSHLQVDVGCDKATSIDDVNADLLSGGNENATMMKLEGEKDSAEAAEVDKTSCGSPTIISSSEPSQMDKQEETKGSVITDKSVIHDQSATECAKPKDAQGDDTSFTFKVNALPDAAEGEPGRSWSPFPNTEKCKSSSVVEEASPSVKGKAVKTPSKRTPRQSTRASDGEPLHGTPKGTSERKGRRASAKGATKENAKKGSKGVDVNEEHALVKGEKSSNTSLSMSSSIPHVQFGMTPPYGLVEQSNSKFSGVVAAPHLSSSTTSPSASLRQPFTDLQQVQLRAQIFVYGSLIQGIAADEACMASAFGPSDGGRSIWEPVWRAAVERVRSQKSNSPAAETPLHSQSVAKASDTAMKPSAHANKALSSPVSRSNSKGAPAAAINPIIPLSSPLWSVSTPSRDSLPSSVVHKGPTLDYQPTVTPLHSYQTPPMKSFVGQTPWPQTCFPGPWLASPQTSTFNPSICFQPVTMAETMKLTPAKGAPGPITSGIKHKTSSPAAVAVEARPVIEGVSSLPGSKPNASAEKPSVESKSRKRKKVPASDPGLSSLSEPRSEPTVLSKIAATISSPVVVPGPPSPALFSLNKAGGDTSTVCPIDRPIQKNMNTGKVIISSEDTMSKVAEAKNQAEDAAALATAALSHSENLWGQLVKQKESGLISEAEQKLASAAAAISAAASVAKAAAAAAKVAYSAVLQAKEMADEALLSGKTSGSGRSPVDVHDMGNATPESIFKGGNMTNQSKSILVAAKEAAKRRVEAASAASKQAENLDAIIKAAELAAAAVSQAGKIVAMGEPLTLSGLMEAGPEGYWKLPHSAPELAEKLTDKNKEVGEGTVIPAKASGGRSGRRGGSDTAIHGKTSLREKSNDLLDGHVSLAGGIMGPTHNVSRDFKNSVDFQHSETAKPIGVLSPSDSMPRAAAGELERDELVESVPEDSINEGSVVEVFKHGDGLKSAWYAANVLRLEDGKAYVCYSDLLSEQGSANLCEWVTLEGEGHNAPIIRPAHPSTTLPVPATRKRRRAALGDYAWSVGDRVDVWIDDCWWEGVVTEKNEKDETTLKVHFPAQSETSTVRAWNLRTSRTWKDGRWVEWSSSRETNGSEQSDAPQEKRQKLGSLLEPTNGKDKLATDLDSGSGKPGESNLLSLSTNDRTFNIGKATRDDKRHDAQRTLRSGLQKEGSRVIFGVPKPTGKKRKFMEVSKHFPATRSDKSNETTDSVKFAKYLMPQATTSRGWKAPSRNESKEKRTAETKSRVPNSRRSNRKLPPRENRNTTLARDREKSTDNVNDTEAAAVHDENGSEKLVEPVSSTCEGAPEAPLSSLLANTLNAPSRKALSSTNRSERVNKGKLESSGGNLSKMEEKVQGNAGDPLTGATEPRRSNRRIQPTHRLLEGLQSSMIIPKMPSVSHDRGPRNPSRNVSAKGNVLLHSPTLDTPNENELTRLLGTGK